MTGSPSSVVARRRSVPPSPLSPPDAVASVRILLGLHLHAVFLFLCIGDDRKGRRADMIVITCPGVLLRLLSSFISVVEFLSNTNYFRLDHVVGLLLIM